MKIRRLFNLYARSVLVVSIFAVLMLNIFAVPANCEERKVIFSDGLAPQSFAWQIEEIAKWLIRSRDLIPKPSECKYFCFAINTMTLTGSLEKNQLFFTMEGNVLSEEPALIPLFGIPKNLLIKNVMINNKPAVLGFEGKNHYFVQASDKSFTIKGELSFNADSNLRIIGPVNSFYGNIEDGRIIQGNTLSGLANELINIESTKIRPVTPEPEVKPLFQVNRAIRIGDEISFQYFIFIRSPEEIRNFQIPFINSENVLEIKGLIDYKLEKDKLIINSAQRSIQFSISGTLDNLENLKMDERSGYEWWLAESDNQHRITIKTEGRQYDSSESPMPRLMSSSRLYFLSAGHTMTISMQKLKSLEALAAVILTQRRKTILTKNGDLVSQDTFEYQNSGIDYLIFDTAGKPIYLEINKKPQMLLSQEDIPDTALLLPLLKGKHQAYIQNISKIRIGTFFGSFIIPMPTHSLTASRGYVELGLPEKIIPLYFSEGTGIISPFSWFDLFMLIIIIIISGAMFRSIAMRFLSAVFLCGLFLLIEEIFIILLIISIAVRLILYLKEKYSGKAFNAVVIIGCAVLAVIILYGLSQYLAGSSVYEQAGDAHYMEIRSIPPSPPHVTSDEYTTADRLGQRRREDMEYDYEALVRERESAVISDSSIIEGIIPVALPMPGYSSALYADRELISRERPFSPRLIYITKNILIPIYILWILSVLVMIRHFYPKLKVLTKKWIKKTKTPANTSADTQESPS